jgi:hypothetical protein
MSLDVTLTKTMPTEVYGGNITHNLGKMAAQVKLWPSGLTLYEVLWHPEKHNLTHAKDIAEMLDESYNILLVDPQHYRQFNPENGWGNYDNLCDFVYKYRSACWDNPDAEISVCR